MYFFYNESLLFKLYFTILTLTPTLQIPNSHWIEPNQPKVKNKDTHLPEYNWLFPLRRKFRKNSIMLQLLHATVSNYTQFNVKLKTINTRTYKYHILVCKNTKTPKRNYSKSQCNLKLCWLLEFILFISFFDLKNKNCVMYRSSNWWLWIFF